MNNKKKKLIIIVLVLVIALSISAFFIYRFVKNKKEENVQTKTIEVLDQIKNYDYHLEDRDRELYKETFLKLKNLLEKNEIVDDKLYAEYLSILFLVDLYTIENKISKYDVGSLDFIYPEEKEKFQNKVMDTMYKLVLDNSGNTRNQELPEVSKVEINKLEETEYQKGNTKLPGYLVNATIEYKKDLGYDKNVTLTLVKEENKLCVVTLKSA